MIRVTVDGVELEVSARLRELADTSRRGDALRRHADELDALAKGILRKVRYRKHHDIGDVIDEEIFRKALSQAKKGNVEYFNRLLDEALKLLAARRA